MVLQGLSRQFRQALDTGISSEEALSSASYSTELAQGTRRAPAFNVEEAMARLPFSQPGFVKPLAARLLGRTDFSPQSQPSPLSESQETLLQNILSQEVSSAELSLLQSSVGESLTLEAQSALIAYRGDLVSRLEVLEIKLSEELTALEEEISDLTGLLSGEEDSSEELSSVELELEALEARRESLEADLGILSSLKEELSLSEGLEQIELEELLGPAEDLLAFKREQLQKDWDIALESLRQQTPAFAKLPHIEGQLADLLTPNAANLDTLILLQAQADLWAVTEARIEQFGQMMKVAGITDGIINLGGLTKEDLAYAQEYNYRQSDYSKVLRYLVEGKAGDALELFQGLEASPETKILFEAYEDAETINVCTMNALTVVGAGAAAKLAMPIIRGLALMGNVSSKAIPALQFAGQVGTFTVAHRQLNGWVMEEGFFDPNLGAIQNAEVLTQEFLFNAGMFAFLGMSHKLFAVAETKALHSLAKRRGVQASQLQYGPMQIEAEAASGLILKQLQRSQITQFAHITGSFGTELVGFGAWDYLAANLQGLASGDHNARRIFAETLGSQEKWERNLVFLMALKAGGALAAPVFRPMNRSAEAFARARYHGRLSELERNARDCAQALQGHLENPRGSLELLTRYESALETKLEFLREMPSELSHPAILKLLQGEIKNIRDLRRAIEAGVFDSAANDGGYDQLPPRIDRLPNVGGVANDGKYPTFVSPRMRLAVGAEEYQPGPGETISSEMREADAPDAVFRGLQAVAMGAADSTKGIWHRLGRSIGRLFGKAGESPDGQPPALRVDFSGDAPERPTQDILEMVQDIVEQPKDGRLIEMKVIVQPGIAPLVLKLKENIGFLTTAEFLPAPEFIKRGQYVVMTFFAGIFSEASLSPVRVIDLSTWDLEPRWESAIRDLAFAHPNLVQLQEIRIGRRVFQAEEGSENLKLVGATAMEELASEFKNGAGKGFYLDKDADPAQRLQWLRFAQWYHLRNLGNPSYVKEVSELLKVVRDPGVSKKAMIGTVGPLERPGGYPHALRLEAARVFVEAVELSGSGELAELGVKNLRELLMEPDVFSHYERRRGGGLSRKERFHFENKVRKDLFPFLLRLLPYLPTDSIEVTAGFTMLGKADWIRAWDEAHPHPQAPAPPAVVSRNVDDVYRERPETLALGPRKVNPCVQVGLAYAGYLAAASPFQLELSKDLRSDIDKRWSGWLLSHINEGSEEVARAVAIWAKHHNEVARAIERLPAKSPFRDSVSKAWDEVDRVSRRRLEELMDKRVEQWGSGIGPWVRALLGWHSPWTRLSQSNPGESGIKQLGRSQRGDP